MLAPAVLSVVIGLSGSLEGPESGSSYPIAPVSLIDHLHEAEFFGLVEVVSIEDEERTSDEASVDFYFPAQRVTLRVHEDWKGERNGELIVSREFLSMGCPAPPDYKLGEKRVAFLNRSDDGKFSTNGLSYGTKAAEASESYRRACKGWWGIQGSFDSDQADEKYLAEFEWLIAGLEDEHLRADMLRVLYPESANPKPRFPRGSYRDCVANLPPERMKTIAQSVSLDEGWQAGMFCGFWALVEPKCMVDWLTEEILQCKITAESESYHQFRSFRYAFAKCIQEPIDRARFEDAWGAWVRSVRAVERGEADSSTLERRQAKLLKLLDAKLFDPTRVAEK